MDAEAIDLPDASVDAVLCRLGLMFLPDLDRALAGVHRVLVPGGRFAAAIPWRPADQPMPRLVGAILDALGLPRCPRPHRAGPGSSASPTPPTSARPCSGPDWPRSGSSPTPSTFDHRSPDEWLEFLLALNVPLRQHLAGVPEQRSGRSGGPIAAAAARGCTTTGMSASPATATTRPPSGPRTDADEGDSDETVHRCHDHRRGPRCPSSDRADRSAGSGRLRRTRRRSTARCAPDSSPGTSWRPSRSASGWPSSCWGRRWFATGPRPPPAPPRPGWPPCGCSPPGCPTRRFTSTSACGRPPCSPVEWVFHGGAILAIAALLWALSSPATPGQPHKRRRPQLHPGRRRLGRPAPDGLRLAKGAGDGNVADRSRGERLRPVAHRLR